METEDDRQSGLGKDVNQDSSESSSCDSTDKVSQPNLKHDYRRQGLLVIVLKSILNGICNFSKSWLLLIICMCTFWEPATWCTEKGMLLGLAHFHVTSY